MEVIESAGEKVYVCVMCRKSFKRGDNLKKHMATHNGARPYKCSLCEKSFRARGHLNAHLLIHTGEKPFKCNVCERGFNQNSNLKKHIKLHTGNRPYVCEVCQQTFTQLCYLKEHLKCHTGEREFGCLMCPKRFKNNNLLKSHMITHSQERPFKCTICDKVFKYSRNYVLHKIAHDNEVVCYCSECGKEFRNQNRLKRHMLVHQGIQLFECFICGKEFRKADNLKKHLVVHSGEKPFHCEICGKTFRSQSNLKSHMILHSIYHPYSCDICGKKFKYKCNYSRHMNCHTGQTIYTCTMCNAVFNSKSSLDSHHFTHVNQEDNINYPQESIEGITAHELMGDDDLQEIIHNIEAVELEEKLPSPSNEPSVIVPSTFSERVHFELEGRKPFECHVCGKEYTTSTNLKIHMRNHTGERPFKCTICNKDFTQNSLLKVHMRSHTRQRPYSCNICNKNFKHSSHLHTHHRGHNEHGGQNQRENVNISVGGQLDEPVNTCNICGKIFVRKYMLKRHMLVHSDKRAFSCNHCDKKFKENSHLKAHTMLHTGERPFDCNICGKKFIQKSDQKRHMRTHSKSPSKGRPFTCAVCGLKFAYMHNLETHKIIHAMRKNKHTVEESSVEATQSMDDGETEGITTIIDSGIKEEQTHHITICEKEETDNMFEGQLEMGAQKKMTDELLFSENTSAYPHEVVSHESVGSSCTLIQDADADGVLKENIILVYSSQTNSLQNEPSTPYSKKDDTSENVEPSDVNKYEGTLCRIQIDTQIKGNVNEDSVQYDSKDTHEQHEQTTISPKVIRCSSYSETKYLSQDPAIYECLVCGKIYSSVYTLRRHMILHSGLHSMIISKAGKCPTCGKKFSRMSNLKRHMTVHTGERPFACDICSKKFKEKGHLKTHMLLVHSNDRPYRCNICGKRLALRSDHKRHVRSHRGDKPFCCVLCGSKFTTKRNLESHKIIHAMKKNRYNDRMKNDVIVSDAITVSSQDIPIKHESGLDDFVESKEIAPVASQPIEDNDRLTIQTYTGTFSKPQDRFNETRSEEISKALYSVKPVLRFYSGNQSRPLEQTEEEEAPNTGYGRNSMCDCGVPGLHNTFEDKFAQKKIEPITEVQIGKITVQAIPYELAKERNSIYECERNFKCSECGKMFSTNHNRKIHMRIHTGERPFKCTICSKDFTQKSNLKIHMNTHKTKK